MATVHHIPFPSQRLLEASFNHMCDNWFGPGEAAARVGAAWQPPVDVRDEQERLVILADMPGMSREQITVKAENGQIILSGERQPSAFDNNGGQPQGRYTHRERSQGRFERRFRLPDDVDVAAIEARYAQGVLEVILPKNERSRTKNIDVAYLQ